MFSPMGYAPPQGHMPYPIDNLGQPLIGCSPQYGYMTDRQHSLRSWSQAPSQQGVYMPEDYQAVQTQDSYTQGQTESQKRSAQYLKQLALQEAEQALLPKSLYFSRSSTWAEFYRKFLNYARDKHWSSQECKTNMGYVLDGKAAEYFHFINNQEPCLQYYDLLIRMENFIKEHNSQGVLSPVKTCPNNNLTDTRIHCSAPSYISHQSGSSLRLFSSSVEENCRQKGIYTPYIDPHSVTNSIIESQSIDTDIMSSSYRGCTFNETKESDTGIAFESEPQCQQRQR